MTGAIGAVSACAARPRVPRNAWVIGSIPIGGSQLDSLIRTLPFAVVERMSAFSVIVLPWQTAISIASERPPDTQSKCRVNTEDVLSVRDGSNPAL